MDTVSRTGIIQPNFFALEIAYGEIKVEPTAWTALRSRASSNGSRQPVRMRLRIESQNQTMLGNAAATPFDLRFSLFGIPVRVHPLFWVAAAASGWYPDRPALVFLWIACFFVSILVHELGHALTAQYFGWPPHIVLYLFGGWAAYTPAWGQSTRRSVLISFAGPCAGFLLFGIALLVEQMLEHQQIDLPDQAYFALKFLKRMNLWWSVFNLAPVYPLDGGQIARELLTHSRPRDGLEISLKLSILIGGGLAGYFFTQQQTFGAMLFAMLAFESFQYLQAMRYR